METVDRTTWTYLAPADGETEDVDEYIDAHSLRCMICTEGFSDPVQVAECGHRFCRSCLHAWFHSQGQSVRTCPMDRGPIASPSSLRPAPSDVTRLLSSLRVECRACDFVGARDDHLRLCPQLKCRFARNGCAFVGQDATAVSVHARECLNRDSFCPDCFTKIALVGQEITSTSGATSDHNKKTCTFQSPLLDWAPSLSFGMTPTDLVRALFRLTQPGRMLPPDADLPMLVYSAMPVAREIPGFECRYYIAPYAQAIGLFRRDIGLPVTHFVTPSSYVCFLFELNMGLRLVSIRLHPAHYQLEHTLAGCIEGFLETNRIPVTEPISVDRRRPECAVLVGRNTTTEDNGERGEWNIEFLDSRVDDEMAGGTRAHAQMREFVHFL